MQGNNKKMVICVNYLGQSPESIGVAGSCKIPYGIEIALISTFLLAKKFAFERYASIVFLILFSCAFFHHRMYRFGIFGEELSD